MDIKNINRLIAECDNRFKSLDEFINKYLPLKCMDHFSRLVHASVDKRTEKKLNDKERKLFDE